MAAPTNNNNNLNKNEITFPLVEANSSNKYHLSNKHTLNVLKMSNSLPNGTSNFHQFCDERNLINQGLKKLRFVCSESAYLTDSKKQFFQIGHFDVAQSMFNSPIRPIAVYKALPNGRHTVVLGDISLISIQVYVQKYFELHFFKASNPNDTHKNAEYFLFKMFPYSYLSVSGKCDDIPLSDGCVPSKDIAWDALGCKDFIDESSVSYSPTQLSFSLLPPLSKDQIVNYFNKPEK